VQESTETRSRTHAETEEWFINSQSVDPLPLEDMLTALSALVLDGRQDLAENWTEMLHDTLAERLDKAGTMRLLKLRAGWHDDDSAFRDLCVKVLYKVFKGKIGQSVVNSAGFEAGIAPRECLRRLDVLMSLKPGILCHEKTWGCGTVKNVDEFYQKVVVDFEKKKGHQMSFAYAAEVLEILSDDHLFAMKHRDPEGFAKLLREDPAEVVRHALRSFGPLSVIRIKEILVGPVMPESDWKGFWEVARKGLKADPLIKIPAGREDPIRMLEQPVDHQAELFESLKQERDMETILDLITDLEARHKKKGLPEDVKQVIVEKLAFVLKGVRGRGHGTAAIVAIMAKRIGVADLVTEVPTVVEGFFTPKTFLAATSNMPAKEVGNLITLLAAENRQKLADVMLSLLASLPLSVLNDSMDFLIAEGKQKECADSFRLAVRSEKASIEMLYWLCRHVDTSEEWKVGTLSDILIRVVNALELPRSGKALTTQKQLRDIFAQKAWMEDALKRMDGRQREALLSKINVSRGWEPVEQRAVMATMVKLYPELSSILAAGADKEEKQTKAARFTSWRTYNHRMEQLRKIVEIDIPKNSKEIGIARSYGDLRENSEYKAAKEHQNILMRRQEEYEADLQQVQGTDFSAFVAEVAGVGTSVHIKDSAGAEERYNILGEWDGDEELSIISSKSALAQALTGHKAGDDVVIPEVTGEKKAKILEVTRLSDAVRKWATGAQAVP
jgi:transcription elongation GreA/GreB family factor